MSTPFGFGLGSGVDDPNKGPGPDNPFAALFSGDPNALGSHLAAVKDGMGVPHLFQWDIKRLPLMLPGLDEQRRIADFLDDATARLDRLISLRSDQVSNLRRRRWSLFQHLLNPGITTA